MKRVLIMFMALCVAMSCMTFAVSAEVNVLTVGSSVTVEQDATYSFTPTESTGYYIYDTADNAVICVTVDGGHVVTNSGKAYFDAVAGTTYEIGIYVYGETATIKLQKAVAPTSVAFEETSVTGYVGDSFGLFLTYAPEHTFSPIRQIQVGDDSIISAGIYYDDMVYGEFKSAGTTTVTVTTASGKTATATVTAKAAEQLKLNETKTVTAEQEQEFVFTFTPSKTGVYVLKSESTEDVSVNLYSYFDTDEYDTYVAFKGTAGVPMELRASCYTGGTFKLTVIEGNQPASISIDTYQNEIYVGQEFYMEVVSDTEYVMLNTVEWTVSDSSCFEAETFPQQARYLWVTPKKAGTFTVTAKAENGKTATKTITVMDNPVIKCGEQKLAEGTVVYTFTPTETAEYVIYADSYPNVCLAGNAWVEGLKEVGSKDYRGYAGVLDAGTTYYISVSDETVGVDKMVEDPDPYILFDEYLIAGGYAYFRVVGDGFIYNEDYTWTSSDPSVINFEYKYQGYGECLKEGKATVTAEKDGKKLTCQVEVESFGNMIEQMYSTNKIVSGGNTSVADNAIQDHTITIEGDADEFFGVIFVIGAGDKLDQEDIQNEVLEISAEELSVTPNGSKFSVVIPGTAIQKLGIGKHQLVFFIGEGGAMTSLSVAASDNTNPPTGDTTLVLPAVIMMVCAVLGMSISLYTYRKKQ